VLLPDKHVAISESILGLAALVVANLSEPLSFDQVMSALSRKFQTPEWPAYHNAETVSLALCLLYSAGIIDVTIQGDLYRCA
jgi:hypothetical protein